MTFSGLDKIIAKIEGAFSKAHDELQMRGSEYDSFIRINYDERVEELLIDFTTKYSQDYEIECLRGETRRRRILSKKDKVTLLEMPLHLQ